MAERKIVKVVFQFRRATTEEWNLHADEIPYAGEPCYDLDLGTLRIGNGKTAYKDLKVIGNASISDDGLALIVNDLQSDVYELQTLVGGISVESQIAEAIANISYGMTEAELQDMINSVFNN